MDINGLLLQATTLMGLGMTFVFLFLGLLMLAVMLMAKYVPADKVVSRKNGQAEKEAAGISATPVNPKLIAAITGAVQQYRKTAKA